ncbi:MAG: diguanylate cyclase (GGDEF)-like protein [Paraglaciecola sp.]|jgi:diguanylate cyclase (GGDEF)-like protein
MDLLKRSMTGVLVYAFVLPVIFLAFDFHRLQPMLSLYLAGSMLLISILRLLHKIFTPRLYDYSAKLWFWIFAILSLGHAIVLSTVFAFSMYDTRFIPILHVIILTVGGVASGALIGLVPRIKFALFNLFVLLVPSIVIGLLLEDRYVFSVMILIFGFYIAAIGIRSHREYIRSFKIEALLDRQKSELEALNKTDALTHIYNRGYFNTQFEYQWNTGMRHNIRQTLLLIDIDHFKLINDNYGHLVGDTCLQQIAQLVNVSVNRKNDLVARFGGEEFALLLDASDSHQAIQIAETIRQSIADCSFKHDDITFNVTVSIGVASVIPTPKMNSNRLIEAADKALYQAKDKGRNQVVLSTELA